MSELTAAKVERLLFEKAVSVDELAQFRAKEMWFRDDDRTEEIDEFLDPHSITFFSTLRPLFLHQLKSVDALSYFTPVLCKDGLLSLAHFFRQNPVPPAFEDTLLLVNRKLSAFVPARWRPRVAYYRPVSRQPAESIATCEKVYFVLSVIDEKQCSVEHLERVVRKVKALLGARKSPPRCELVVFYNQMFNQTVAGADAKTAYLFRLLGALRNAWGIDPIPVRWSEIEESELAGSAFLDLNELDFYYSDSFVSHHFLSHGSLPIEVGEAPIAPEFTVPASLHHAYGVSRYGADLGASDLLHARMGRFLESPLFREEESAFRPKDSFERGDKYGPRSFESMVYALARETFHSP